MNRPGLVIQGCRFCPWLFPHSTCSRHGYRCMKLPWTLLTLLYSDTYCQSTRTQMEWSRAHSARGGGVQQCLPALGDPYFCCLPAHLCQAFSVLDCLVTVCWELNVDWGDWGEPHWHVGQVPRWDCQECHIERETHTHTAGRRPYWDSRQHASKASRRGGCTSLLSGDHQGFSCLPPALACLCRDAEHVD